MEALMTIGEFLVAYIILGCLMGGLGWWIAKQRHRPELEGLLLGFVFGPLGAVIEALLPLGDPTAKPASVFRPSPPRDPPRGPTESMHKDKPRFP